MGKQGSSKRQTVQKSVHLDLLRKALQWIVNPNIFHNLEVHGNTNWKAENLVVLAVLWVWSEKTQLTAAFNEAAVWAERLGQRTAVKSYQGLTGALVKYSSQLVPMLWGRLHKLMEQVGAEHWRIGGWLPLAVDGSRVGTPRTKSNEKAFRAANYGKGKTAKYRKKKNKRKKKRVDSKNVMPQIWLTLVWHMGMRLPWCWKMGPSDSSERKHFQEMLCEHKFPKNTLFCGDAGFTGYELWKQIMDQNHHFLIRVGANVRLLKRLGYYARERDGIVYVWPDSAARKNQPPLTLRLIHLKNERGDIYLLTNILAVRNFSDNLASRLYQLRWGIEVQFRTLKRTFGRHTLRSRTPQRAYVELEWALLGLWMIHLFAVKEQIKIGEPPSRTSAAMAISVIRSILFLWCEVPDPGKDLTSQLQQALLDPYRRHTTKRGRYHPNKKDKPSAGKPKIIIATKTHQQLLKRYQRHLQMAT